MQRVLTFQMARGLGETSEFVTKRMCFSFLFSVGFLCLLCGFLLGRFTTERTIEFRAEKKRLELAGNGLESTDHIQHHLTRELEETPFDINLSRGRFEDNLSSLLDIFSNLSLFHDAHKYKDCLTVLVRGSREPDRYVVLSVSEEIGGIGLELAKILNRIQNEYNWKPRRSLIFCTFSGTVDSCIEVLSSFVRQRIVAYIAVHRSESQTSPCFTVSGSNILQSIVLEVATTLRKENSYENLKANLAHTQNSQLPVPHVVFSLADDIKGRVNDTRCQVNVVQVLSQSVWRLSECLAIKWNTSYFNKPIITTMEYLNHIQYVDPIERMRQAVVKLLAGMDTLNKKIDSTESAKSLEIRMLNDFSMELDKVLLCSIKTITSSNSTAIPASSILMSNYSVNDEEILLTEMTKCYEDVVQFLNEWTNTR